MMHAATLALAVMAALTIGWDVHQEANVAGNQVVCDFEGGATVDDVDPTQSSVDAAPPACTAPV